MNSLAAMKHPAVEQSASSELEVQHKCLLQVHGGFVLGTTLELEKISLDPQLQRRRSRATDHFLRPRAADRDVHIGRQQIGRNRAMIAPIQMKSASSSIVKRLAYLITHRYGRLKPNGYMIRKALAAARACESKMNGGCAARLALSVRT